MAKPPSMFCIYFQLLSSSNWNVCDICRVTGKDFGSALLLNGDRNLKRQRVASTGQAAIQILIENSVDQWLDLPSLDSTFCISRAIAILIRDTPKKVSYDMTKLNEFDEFRLFLCARCYITSLSMVSYINDFLRNCNTRKICYENRGFQVSFEDPFGFVPFYLESGVGESNIGDLNSEFPESRKYQEDQCNNYEYMARYTDIYEYSDVEREYSSNY